jgi:hypothetical protein
MLGLSPLDRPLARTEPDASTVGRSAAREDDTEARASRNREVAVRTSRLPWRARCTRDVNSGSSNDSHHRDNAARSAGNGAGSSHATGATGPGATYGRRTPQAATVHAIETARPSRVQLFMAQSIDGVQARGTTGGEEAEDDADTS